MRKIIPFLVFFCVTLPVYGFNHFFQTCPQALPTNNPGFCASFKVSATCHCSQTLPSGMCQDVNLIYWRMIDMFGSPEAACEWEEKTQHDTTKQQCIDDWKCYLSGGTDSQGNVCSSTGKACS